ncbi:Uncharacterised protein [Mycobacteroides abscessus subsp. massiliense]|nr:Uncharacterised protein [Mycobacteroides abscessus subsp. massiliense]
MTLGTEPRPPAQGPGYGYQPAPPAPPSRGPRRGLTPVIAGVALVVGVGVGAIAGVSLAGKESAPQSAVQSAPPPATLTPSAAKDRVCNVLRTDYPAVSAAIDEVEKYNKSPWSDPLLLSAVNSEVDSINKLINGLETALTPEVPSDLRTAVLDYIAGLRAISISDRNHANNVQVNGTGLFYNQVLDAPLRICGISS